jgi:hypothetical protein
MSAAALRAPLLFTALLAVLPAAAFAQVPAPSPAPTPVPDICSTGLSAVVSRPTETTSACTVAPNQVLIETGYQSQTVDVARGSFTFQSVPNATIRIGTALPGIEVQVLPPTLLRSSGVSATGDAGLGLKWQMASSPAFAYGINAIVTAATGSNPRLTANGLGSAGASTYVMNLNLQGALNSVFGYGAGLGIQNLAAPTGVSGEMRYISTVPSIDITAALPAAWAIAVEAYHDSNGEGPSTPGHLWLDAALEKDIGKAQFDVSYGISNRVAPAPGAPGIQRHYVGFGLSYGF